MKLKKILLLLLLPLFVFSCKDDDIDLIHAILPDDELVSLKTDTFHLSARDTIVEKILWKSTNNTILLGTFTDKLFGVTTGEILTQFNCPSINSVNWPLPPTVDSTALFLSITFNGKNAKIGDTIVFQLYEMDKAVLDIPAPSASAYYSDINVDAYTNKSIVLANYTYIIKTTSADTITTIRIPLDNSLKDKFITASVSNQSVYSSESAFVQFFKGIYIKATTKKSSILTVTNMYMSLIYWYKITDENSTVISRFDEKQFPASNEVRKVNYLTHNNYSGYFSTANDSVIYVNAPAGKNAIVNIPLKQLKDSLGITTTDGVAYVGRKKVSVNNGLLTLEVTDKTKTSLSPPTHLLMIKRGTVKDNFFKNSELPDGKNAILAEYSSTTASYSFNMRDYLANEFKSASMPDNEELEIIPVDITGTKDSPSSVQYCLGLYGASLRTKKNISPLKMNVLISGF